jgi:hypothetical protein
MRVLGSIVQALVAPMLSLRQDSANGRRIAADLQQHLVGMAFVARSCLATAQPGRERRAELGAPLADRLVAHDWTTP